VLCGATRPAHVLQNVEAVGWKLSGEDMKQVNRIIGKEGG